MVPFLPVRLSAVFLALMVTAASAEDLSDADKAINNVVVVGAAGEAPTAWLGETPHFVMVGTFKDYEFNIQVPNLEAMSDIGLSGKREYRPGANGLDYIDFEVALNAITNGIERSIELEFENANFSAHSVPSTFELQGEEFPEGLLSNLEFAAEWEWVEKSVIVNEEELMDGGALTVALETGDAGEDGTVATGLVGGFVSAEFDGKPIAISFTTPVSEAEIDD